LACSVCGHEGPAGDRFCGMCGTPLPYRPLSISGAQGTLNLTRGPLGNAQSNMHSAAVAHGVPDAQHADGGASTAETAVIETRPSDHDAVQEIPDVPIGTLDPSPALAETPEEQADTFSNLLSSGDRAPVDPLPEVVRGHDHSVAGRAEEPPATALAVSDFLDELATSPEEPATAAEAPHFPWMDDVLQQIEREAVKTSEERDERPRFLDLLGDLSAPAPATEVPAQAVAAAPVSDAGEMAASTADSALRSEAEIPSRGRRPTWYAAVAILVFVALATIQWRAEMSRTAKGLVEAARAKVQRIANGGEGDNDGPSSGISAGSADPGLATQTIQAKEEPKPEGRNTSGNANSPAGVPAENPSPASSAGPASVDSKLHSPPPSQALPVAPAKKAPPGEATASRETHDADALALAVQLWKATAKGDPTAPVQLADLYIKGDGVPRSCEQAVVLLKTAALKDNARACNRLASLYATGTCVPRSHVEAYRWFSSALAAEPANASARQNRDLIWQQMTPEEQAQAQKDR